MTEPTNGTPAGETIYGTADADKLKGKGGDDTFYVFTGNDAVDGGAGDDTAVFSGRYEDYTVTLKDTGNFKATVVGLGSDAELKKVETIEFSNGSYDIESGIFTPDAPPEPDTVDYSFTILGVEVDLALNTATGPEIGTETLAASIVNVIGGSGNDVLRGDAGDNTLNGNGGNDFLVGRAGSDILNGGNGIDVARFIGLRADYMFGPGTVTNTTSGDVDSTNSVELLQFDDSYMLGFGMTPINLTGFGLAGGIPLFGRNGVTDLLTMGMNANGRLIDLAGGIDTLTLGAAGSYSLNLANVETLVGSFGNETVTLSAAAVNMSIDLSFGLDLLNLSSANDTVTVTNVESVFNFGGADTVTFVHNDFSAGQTFNLGFGGDDTLNLAGSDSNYSLTLFGDLTVVGASDSGNEVVNVFNNQAGSTFDLGAGTDTLTLNSSAFPNSVTVENVENVTAIGVNPDSITIAGNSGGITTVTAGSGSDMITASTDEDHFRFIQTGDSPYDLPFAGQRDIITGFDADEDKFVFDNIPGTIPANFGWDLINFGGADIVLVDLDGGGMVNPPAPGGYSGYEMAIQVIGLTGTLDQTDFLLI